MRSLVRGRRNYGFIASVSGCDLHKITVGQSKWRVVGCRGVSRSTSDHTVAAAIITVHQPFFRNIEYLCRQKNEFDVTVHSQCVIRSVGTCSSQRHLFEFVSRRARKVVEFAAAVICSGQTSFSVRYKMGRMTTRPPTSTTPHLAPHFAQLVTSLLPDIHPRPKSSQNHPGSGEITHSASSSHA